jgi:hypothetical protein
MERYNEMPASKANPFVLNHACKLFEHSEKSRLRDQEAPPKKGAFTILDDDESDTEGGRNSGNPDGWKKAKDEQRKLAEAASLRDKIMI